jgi:hypothetical protein
MRTNRTISLARRQRYPGKPRFRRQVGVPRTAKPSYVDTHSRLMTRVEQEQDDVLATVQLVRGDDQLERRLYAQLVDLLVESMFLELRQRYLDGIIERDEYVDELSTLATQCRDAGLLPLPTHDD